MPSVPCLLYTLGKIGLLAVVLLFDAVAGRNGLAKTNGLTVLGVVALYAEDRADAAMRAGPFLRSAVLCVAALQFGQHESGCVLSWGAHVLCIANLALATTHTMPTRLALPGPWRAAADAATPVLMLASSAAVCVGASAAQQLAQGTVCLGLAAVFGLWRAADSAHPVRVAGFTFLCPALYACVVVLVVVAVAVLEHVPAQRASETDDLEVKLRAMEEEYVPAKRGRARGVFAGL